MRCCCMVYRERVRAPDAFAIAAENPTLIIVVLAIWQADRLASMMSRGEL